MSDAFHHCAAIITALQEERGLTPEALLTKLPAPWSRVQLDAVERDDRPLTRADIGQLAQALGMADGHLYFLCLREKYRGSGDAQMWELLERIVEGFAKDRKH